MLTGTYRFKLLKKEDQDITLHTHTHVTLEVCEIITNGFSYLPQDSLGMIHAVHNGIFICNTCISCFLKISLKRALF